MSNTTEEIIDDVIVEETNSEVVTEEVMVEEETTNEETNSEEEKVEEVIPPTEEEIIESLTLKLRETEAKYIELQANYQNKKKKCEDSNAHAKETGLNDAFNKFEPLLLKLQKLNTDDVEFKKGIDMIVTNANTKLELIGFTIENGGKND